MAYYFSSGCVIDELRSNNNIEYSLPQHGGLDPARTQSIGGREPFFQCSLKNVGSIYSARLHITWKFEIKRYRSTINYKIIMCIFVVYDLQTGIVPVSWPWVADCLRWDPWIVYASHIWMFCLSNVISLKELKWSHNVENVFKYLFCVVCSYCC